MFKKFFFFLSFCIVSFVAPAQFFLPVGDDPFAVPISFNAAGVMQNKVKSITATIQYKPDGKIIMDKGLREFYRFDSMGRLNYYWRTKIRSYTSERVEHGAIYKKGKRVHSAYSEFKMQYTYDTTFVNYYFDYKNQLSCRRACEGDYYYAWYYIYNTDGTLARQTHCRETNNGRDHFDFRLGVQTVISQEDFIYEIYSTTQTKKLCLNDEGKPYKETMLVYDLTGHLLDSRESYTAGGIRIVTTWKYDKFGRNLQLTYTSNAGDAIADITNFNYDSLGRIESMKRFHNSVLLDEFSYLYEKSSPFANAYINRRHIDLGIDIVKFTVIYW